MSQDGIFTPGGVTRRYDRLARAYDALRAPLRTLGAYRLAARAVDALGLAPGDRVVDLGTGTGHNLPALADRVGPSGSVLGVDLSARMLERAARRTTGRPQVELRRGDLREVDVQGADAVLATFALEMLDDHDAVVARIAGDLEPGSLIASSGLREPERWPRPLVRVATAMLAVFGVRDAHRSIRPWEAIARCTELTRYEERLGGAVYLAVGTVRGRRADAAHPAVDDPAVDDPAVDDPAVDDR